MSSAIDKSQLGGGLFAGIFARCANKRQPAAECYTGHDLGPSVPRKPPPALVKELAVLPDSQQTSREIQEQARRCYDDYVREHGHSPIWEKLIRNPKFAAAVNAENERIWRQAMEEIAMRRAKEREIHRPIAEEEARNQAREAEPAERKARAQELQKQSSAIYDQWLVIANSKARAPDVPVADKYKGKEAVSRDEYMTALQELAEERAMLRDHSWAMNEYQTQYSFTGGLLKQLEGDKDADPEEVKRLKTGYQMAEMHKTQFGYVDALATLNDVSAGVSKAMDEAVRQRAERESFELVEAAVMKKYARLSEHPFLAADDAEGMDKELQVVRQLVQVQNYQQARQLVDELAQRMLGAAESAIALGTKVIQARLGQLSERIINVKQHGSKGHGEVVADLDRRIVELLGDRSLDGLLGAREALNDLEALLAKAETELRNEQIARSVKGGLSGNIEPILGVEKEKLDDAQRKRQKALRDAWNKLRTDTDREDWDAAARAAVQVKLALQAYETAERQASDQQREKNEATRAKSNAEEAANANACAWGDMMFASGLIGSVWTATKKLRKDGGNGGVGGVYSMNEVQAAIDQWFGGYGDVLVNLHVPGGGTPECKWEKDYTRPTVECNFVCTWNGRKINIHVTVDPASFFQKYGHTNKVDWSKVPPHIKKQYRGY